MRKLVSLIFLIISCAWLPAILAQQPLVPPVDSTRYSAFNAVQLAAVDIAAVAQLNSNDLNPEYCRYLSLHNIAPVNRARLKSVIDGLLNGYNSQFRNIVRTAGIPANSPQPVLLRVNLKDYNIDPRAWDALSEKGSGPVPIPDPYFHVLATQQFQTLAVSRQYLPKLLVTYRNGLPQQSTLNLDIPGTYAVYCNKQKMRTRNGKQFASQDLAPNAPFKCEMRIVGSYGGLNYDVSYNIDTVAGNDAYITMNMPNRGDVKEQSVGNVQGNVTQLSAPWLALEPDPQQRGATISTLVRYTNTKNPILRADWFAVYSSWAPVYYQFLGLQLKDNPDPVDAVKNPKVFLEKDFNDLFGFNFRESKLDILAAITDTKKVTLYNRIIQRFNTLRGVTGGSFWRSQDTDNGIDQQDYLNNISTFDTPSIKAQEIIASGRNDLHQYALTNDKGVILDVAVAGIAHYGDAMPTRIRDKQVFSGRNCMLCHATGQLYLIDKVRNISREKIALLIADRSPNADLSRKIIEAFSPRTESIVDLDNAKFIAATKAATGTDGRIFGSDLESVLVEYYDQTVSLDRMASDAGLTTVTLKRLLQEGINLDYTLVGVLQEPAIEPAILPYERQGFAALMQYLISYQPRK